jgi:hypothetical protein
MIIPVWAALAGIGLYLLLAVVILCLLSKKGGK